MGTGGKASGITVSRNALTPQPLIWQNLAALA